MRKILWLIEAILTLLGLVSSASGQTFTVWSYEVLGGGPRHAHTWVMFESKSDEKVCISWGPLGVVRFMGRAEPGRNMSHEETLGWAKKWGAEVRSVGPFPCSASLFERAKVQKAKLESGLIAYKAAAVSFGPWRANCYAACVQCGQGMFVGGTAYGHEAARRVARFLLGQ